MTNEPKHPASVVAGIEARKIAGQLMKEGGRGAVLLGAARLDFALEKLIKSFFHPNAGGDDNLFDVDRPLATFSAKIALAYRLGLIDKPIEHSLQMIRRVRNDFAHSFEDTSLDEQAHRNRLLKPYTEAKKNVLWKDVRPPLDSAKMPPELCDFIALVVVLVSWMEATTHLQEVVKPAYQVTIQEGLKYRLD